MIVLFFFLVKFSYGLKVKVTNTELQDNYYHLIDGLEIPTDTWMVFSTRNIAKQSVAYHTFMVL